jgi:hypothetical protein
MVSKNLNLKENDKQFVESFKITKWFTVLLFYGGHKVLAAQESRWRPLSQTCVSAGCVRQFAYGERKKAWVQGEISNVTLVSA